MGTYSLLTVVAMVAVVVYELTVARTGIFRTGSYWISMAIVGFFQVLVDGWLTKESSPIVNYDRASFSGIRVFFDSPLEDFGFGFALVTLTMVIWDQLGARAAARSASSASSETAPVVQAQPGVEIQVEAALPDVDLPSGRSS